MTIHFNPNVSIAEQARFRIKPEGALDALTEEGRQVTNRYLSPSAAYFQNGAPRLGMSREPADFAFAAFVHARTESMARGDGLQPIYPSSLGNVVDVEV